MSEIFVTERDVNDDNASTQTFLQILYNDC